MTVEGIKTEIQKLAFAAVDSVYRYVIGVRASLKPKPPAPPKWLHKGRMYAFTDPKCNDGDVFENCNLMQVLPDTEIMVGKKMTLKNCQLTNVKLVSGMTIEGGNTCKWDFCSHNHEVFTKFGLPVCKEFCRHWNDEDKVYEDILLGQSPIPKAVAEIGVN